VQNYLSPYAKAQDRRPEAGYDAPPPTGGVDPAIPSYWSQQLNPSFQGRPAGVQSVAGGDTEIARTNALYNYETPGSSFDNLLRDQGYNPYAANPFIQSMRTMAPGIANAYNMSRALMPSASAQQVMPVTGLDYRNFVNGMFSPGLVNAQGQGSQFYATLANAAQSMPQAIAAARASDPSNVAAVNPFTSRLQEQLAANQGEGGTDMLMSFYGPMMGRGLRQSYGNALEQARAQAQRSYWNGGNLLTNDLYTYLYGV
jgi:hypothetical protein